MPGFIKRLIIICVTLLAIISSVWRPSLVSAQSMSEIKWVKATLWPEYDEPSLWVNYEIHLAETLNYPEDVILSIPAGCTVEDVTTQSAQGESLPIAWDTHPDGDWQQVHFIAVSPVTFFSYRDPGIEENGALRSFIFEWSSNADVESFSLTIYQPYGASQLVIAPPLDRVEKLEDERRVYTKDFGRIALDEHVSVEVQYHKDIANPDYPALKVSPIQPVDGSTTGHSATPLSVVIWLVAVSAVIMVLVTIYYWWGNRKMVHKREHVVRGVGILNPEKQAVFCHECGNRSKAGDAYCRSCGTELRRF